MAPEAQDHGELWSQNSIHSEFFLGYLGKGTKVACGQRRLFFTFMLESSKLHLHVPRIINKNKHVLVKNVILRDQLSID